MADLLQDGLEAWSTSGVPDTLTPASDGPNGTDVEAATVNGPARGVVAIQTILGSALSLKGSAASLAARLATGLAADGALPKGTVFPTEPPPVDGQPFYRVDENQLYIYDAGAPAWKTVFQGLAISTLDHGSLGGLSDDDHTQYQLTTATRDFTGDLKIKKSTPAVRFTGTESQAKDLRIVEDAGIFKFQENAASEGSPSWMDIVTFPQLLMNLPKAMGTGSSRSHEGTVVYTTNDSLSGIHFYDDVTINAGVTMTAGAGTHHVVLIAKNSITINGTIHAVGAGQPGGTGAANETVNGADGGPGTDQPGGQGKAGSHSSQGQGPAVRVHGIAYPGSMAASTLVHSMSPWLCMGGGGGGGGGGGVGPNPGGDGGAGGGSIVLIAPRITLGASSTLNTSGANGGNGSDGGGNQGGGGGGGGAGNVYMICREYTDSGCTFTQTGGSVGTVGTGGSNGTAGVRQILILN